MDDSWSPETAGDVVVDLEHSLEFHRLTGYLYGLATTFSVFHGECPVLSAPDRL